MTMSLTTASQLANYRQRLGTPGQGGRARSHAGQNAESVALISYIFSFTCFFMGSKSLKARSFLKAVDKVHFVPSKDSLGPFMPIVFHCVSGLEATERC